MSELVFTKQRYVSSAFIDSSLKMGIAQSVLMIQDNVTECFYTLGCDGVLYREKFNAFWVFAKTRVKFIRRPSWRETITAQTFPIDNTGLKTHINTQILDAENRPLLLAKQQACVLDLERHRPVRLSSLPYPREHFPQPIFTDDFEKFDCDFSEADFVYEQIIRSQLIDMSHHMNNIEYIKLALNVFSDDFLRNKEVDLLEVHYLGESLEGQTLRIYQKEIANSFFICIKTQLSTVFEMKINFVS